VPTLEDDVGGNALRLRLVAAMDDCYRTLACERASEGLPDTFTTARNQGAFASQLQIHANAFHVGA
jgi:hypothetical protein